MEVYLLKTFVSQVTASNYNTEENYKGAMLPANFKVFFYLKLVTQMVLKYIYITLI
jgi:hypothetical protein